MSRRGGYMILDVSGHNLSSGVQATIPGIYERLEANHGKPVLLSGLNVGGKEYGDIFVDVTLNESAYNFTAYGKTVKIEAEDKITVTDPE